MAPRASAPVTSGAPSRRWRWRADPPHEGLLRNPPRQRHRREGAPLVTGAEARGAIASGAQRRKVAVSDVVVEPPEEGDKLVVDDIPGIANVRGRRDTIVAEQVAAQPRFAQRG